MTHIDKKKLLEHINKSAFDIHNIGNCGHVSAGILVILRDEIESGSFDDNTAQEEINKLKEKLEAKYLSINTGDEEDRYVTQERLIQAEKERDALLEGLEYAETLLGLNLTPIEKEGAQNHIRSIIAKYEGSKTE